MSLIAFSQTGTKTSDSSIRIPKAIAREIAKDLIRKDSLESENIVLKKDIGFLTLNLIAKDSIINSKAIEILLYQQRERNFTGIITTKDAQRANVDELNKKLVKDIKSVKTKLAVRTTVSVGIIGGLIYLFLKK